MGNEQPLALRLAGEMEDNAQYLYDWNDPDQLLSAASELRRQHAEIERLRAALDVIAEHNSSDWPERCQRNVQMAREALTPNF